MSNILAVTYEGAVAISVGTLYVRAFAGLYIGGAGTVQLITQKGQNVTLPGLVAGTILPLAFVEVVSAGTTATNLFGLQAMPYPGVP